MNTKEIDILNIALILISLVLAFKLPFELFLFSYAILGPLHYVTEINWLNNKKYFIKEVRWMWLLFAFCALHSIKNLLILPIFHSIREYNIIKVFLHINIFHEILLTALLLSIGLVFIKKSKYLALFFVCSIIMSFMILNLMPITEFIVGAFLPTIIHVYFFTFLFMIFGVLKSKSRYGLFGIVVMALCPIIIILTDINTINYGMSKFTETRFLSSGFSQLSSNISKIFNNFNKGKFNILSETGIKIQIFIAFSYTFHYLNWFSKTTIIGWQKIISRQKLIAIIIFWVISILLFLYDYKTGVIMLFFFSFLHVLLEFPLNIVSIKGIIYEIKFKKINNIN